MSLTSMRRQRGVVSIFIVIFTALLVTIVTTSFVQIMLRNQQQASNNDLAQSAYDSAMAGVEDAKRALVKLKQCSKDPSLVGCAAVNSLVTSGDNCEVLGTPGAGVVDFVDGEVTVGDSKLNQAYTCVKVEVQTDSYRGKLDANQTVVIPLIPDGDPNSLGAVRISWYVSENLPDGVATPAMPGAAQLTQNSPASWGTNVPPLMRAQIMQFDGSTGNIDLNAFDGGNARTRFLYPLSGARPGSTDFMLDTRRGGSNNIVAGGCEANFGYEGYACSMTVDLPDAPAGQREAYLQLAGIYVGSKGVNYQVELVGSGGGVVDFDNVQPRVDATGRASDLFRRVMANVTVSPAGSPLPFPETTVATGNLCKNFFITNDPTQYSPNTITDADDGQVCEP